MVRKIVLGARSGRKRCLRVEMGDETLTSHGGLATLKACMDRWGVRRSLDERVGHRDGRRYSAGEVLELLIASKVVGDTRLIHLERFSDDEAVRFLFDLPSVPVATTVSRLLRRLTEADVVALEDAHADLLRQRLLSGRRSITVDIDATPLPVWGVQEGTARGYCPSRHGARTYHPNLAFDAKSGLALQGELRPGNRSSIGPVGEIEGFLERLFDRVLPDFDRVRVRMDSGYFADRTLRWLESRKAHYAVGARGVVFSSDVSGRITWSRPRHGVRYGEFAYRFKGWTRERRFVVKRDETKPAQLRFDGIRDTDLVMVTDLPWRPERVTEFYNARGTAEQYIAEGKQEWGLGSFISRKLLPNRVDFGLTLLAMNLVIGYRERMLPIHLRRHRPGTIRRLFLNVAARLIRHGRQVCLRFARALPHREAWDMVFHRLGRSPPATSAAF